MERETWQSLRLSYRRLLVVGFLHRWTLAQGVQNPGVTILLPTVIIVLGLVIYYWFTIRSLKKNKTENGE